MAYGRCLCTRITFHENNIVNSITTYRLSYGLAFTIGCCGNIAVVVAVQKNYSLRSRTNLFIVNLAVADLLVNILCVPFSLWSNLFDGKCRVESGLKCSNPMWISPDYTNQSTHKHIINWDLTAFLRYIYIPIHFTYMHPRTYLVLLLNAI